MAIKVLHYDTNYCNSLPSILDASDHLDRILNGTKVLGQIAQVFLRHHVEDTFGLTLLYNHIPVKNDRKLVRLANMATPWGVDVVDGAPAAVEATSFRFIDGAIAPYEFTCGADQIPMESEEIQGFLSELLLLLKNRGIEDFLGICALQDSTEPVVTEFTDGIAKLFLPVDLSSEAGNVEAMWHFSDSAKSGDYVLLTVNDPILLAGLAKKELDPKAPMVFGRCKRCCKIDIVEFQHLHIGDTSVTNGHS
ncbi:hypothetical protein F4777DRAFT_596009 [Nemania sp. FL0916]|nr:hypothetical protein F4777DRAFT_596009 [Nemania sp. FL0916]